MVGVRGRLVGRVQMAVVDGHDVASAPVVREELVERDEDALVREVARVGVHGLVLGLHVVPEPGDQIADLGAVAPFDRVHRVLHLPHGRGAGGGVAGHQLVEDRGARARAAHDEDRLVDRGLQDLGPTTPELGELQPVAQRLEDLGADQQPTDQVELRLFLQRRHEHLVVLRASRRRRSRRARWSAAPRRASRPGRARRGARRRPPRRRGRSVARPSPVAVAASRPRSEEPVPGGLAPPRERPTPLRPDRSRGGPAGRWARTSASGTTAGGGDRVVPSPDPAVHEQASGPAVGVEPVGRAGILERRARS